MGLHRIVLTKECTDPPMPHEARHAWAERMRRYEAAKAAAESAGEAPAGEKP
jgi:hypothetical protein